ncbi:DNA polymerase I [Haloglycomyces albus]|uniref:DNA polymerase I n=1 Tax=Haloglycomyces albus TaxID=526067 RepID=UPI00046D6B22|nr:DNA polymerase I [Haloglycomyces albus]
MSIDKTRLLLIDGHSMAYRAFFALPADRFSTDDGQTTNAVYGFTSMLLKLLTTEEPTHIAVAFDLSRQTFRTEEYPEYKAGRASTPDEFKSQVPLIQNLLDACNIPWMTKDNYEADDIIATLTRQGREANAEILISSGDRDSIQLVSSHSTLLYPGRKVDELTRYTPDKVAEKYQVTPDQYRIIAALVGEKSDNLPGVPGVGAKTAAKWVKKYQSLDGIIDNLDAIGGKVGDNLRSHVDDVKRNYELNRLIDDLSLDVGLDELEWPGWDVKEVNQLFDGLQFRQLGKRLGEQLGDKAIGQVNEEPEPARELTITTIDPDGLSEWLTDVDDTVSISFRGEFGAGVGTIEALALAVSDRVAWIDPTGMSPADDKAWRDFLADADRPKTLHHEKHFRWAAKYHGWSEPRGVTTDVHIAAYLLKPEQRSFDLPTLTEQYLQRELTSTTPRNEGVLPGLEGSESRETQRDDDAAAAVAIGELAEVLTDKLEQRSQKVLADTLEYPIIGVLAEMESVGIAADDDHFAGIESSFAAKAKEATEEAWATVGRQFNMRSPKQLQEILFEELDMPKTKRTKTGYTTDAEALSGLYAKTGHPLLEQLLRFRDVEKLKQIVATLRATVQDDGRIHTTFHQTVAATGRLSSSDPNLQNIPIRSSAGRDIRAGFVVGSGYSELMTIDYSQIEMRIMASLSEDDDLIDAFKSGEDVHRAVAAKVFNSSEDAVDNEHRSRIKAMSYGLAYGLSAYGLSQQLNVSAEEAAQLREDYFQRFGKVRDYLRNVVETARESGYTETIMGRRRYFPDLKSNNRQRREMAERAALNAPIQGSAADIMKKAMLDVDAAVRERDLESRVLLQVHDELVCEVAPGERDAFSDLVRAKMENAADLAVPLTVSAGFGPSWEAAAH